MIEDFLSRMTVANWLVVVTTLIYLGTAFGHLYEDKLGLSIAFFGYAFANVGLIIAGLKNVA